MDDWENWVGSSTTTTAWLDPAQANRMAVTLDREPNFATGDTLPLAWHWLYFHDVVRASRLGGDGHPELGVVMPPVPLPRRMWAGGALKFLAPIPIGAEATRTSTIRSIRPKRGQTGPLYFVTVEHEISSGGAQPAVIESQTIVYRELPADGAFTATEGAKAPEGADFTDQWHLDNTALFRYSALTFNAHRIHYDADYSRAVEGYPNLVIHGPLLATLLLDSVIRRGELPTHFNYRARSPLFLPEAFTVNGRNDGVGVELWAAAANGRVAMVASATFQKEATDV